MPRLLDSPYLVIDEDPDRRLVRMTRTDVAIDAPETMKALATAVDQATSTLTKSKLRLLVDLRSAPMRAGSTFDPHLQALQRTANGYERSALLIRTKVGALQVTRIARETGVDQAVFFTEQDALAFLDG